MSGIDWSTTEGCERCWSYGPFLPSGFAPGDDEIRDAHVAWHTLVATALPWQTAILVARRLTNALTLPRRKPGRA